LLTIHRPGRSPSLERIGKKRQIRSAGALGFCVVSIGGGSARWPTQPTISLIFEQTQLVKIVPKVHYVDD